MHFLEFQIFLQCYRMWSLKSNTTGVPIFSVSQIDSSFRFRYLFLYPRVFLMRNTFMTSMSTEQNENHTKRYSYSRLKPTWSLQITKDYIYIYSVGCLCGQSCDRPRNTYHTILCRYVNKILYFCGLRLLLTIYWFSSTKLFKSILLRHQLFVLCAWLRHNNSKSLQSH